MFLTSSNFKTPTLKRFDKGDFVQIFDGKTLNGWEGDSTYWHAENGEIVGVITPATVVKQNTFLIWRGGVTANFELKVEYKISENGNSGINYRSEEVKDVPHALRGYQSDIDGKNQYTGQNYEERGRCIIAFRGQKVMLPNVTEPLQSIVKNNIWSAAVVTGSLGNIDSLKKDINEGWNECHLVVKGNRMQHFINGILMSDVTDNDTINRKSSGLLGVQVHVGPPMKVEYRNFRLKKLK
ncbi:MAG: DUF1080 domain-containing protein [Bacteroidota bacterium]|nr:DUF1080 domain-containing protein [Bacteroidota bacterium]